MVMIYIQILLLLLIIGSNREVVQQPENMDVLLKQSVQLQQSAKRKGKH